MKKATKFFSGALAALMAFSALTACDFGGGDSEVNMDIDLNQKIDLNVLMPSSGRDISAVNADPNALRIEELTGYDVQYYQLPGSDASTSLRNDLTARAPYHAMKLTSAQFADQIAEEMLLPLDEVLDKFGPEIKRVISDGSWDVVTVDGKIYGIPEKASSDNIENPIIFNKFILNELNLSVPMTKEELKTVLQTIKTQKGITPLTFDKNQTLIYPISAAFGIYSEWQEYTIDGQTEVRFYMDAPGYTDYVDYMHDLFSSGLIKQDVQDKDASKALQEFGSGQAAALATSLWSVGSVVNIMEENALISEQDTLAPDGVPNALSYLRSLENADGEEKVYRTSGYTYIMAIPFYMAENAGYVIDWINSKLTDTDEAHNFRESVIGEEGVHWTYTARDGYQPLMENFDEMNTADYYLTGSNEEVYTEYWKARIRKTPEMYRAWDELMTDADEVGVYNVADALPPITEYSKNRSYIEQYAQRQFYLMMRDGTGSFSELLAHFKANGGTTATNAINNWYLNK